MPIEELARRARIPQGKLRRILAGNDEVLLGEQFRLARAIGLAVSELWIESEFELIAESLKRHDKRRSCKAKRRPR